MRQATPASTSRSGSVSRMRLPGSRSPRRATRSPGVTTSATISAARSAENSILNRPKQIGGGRARGRNDETVARVERRPVATQATMA